jgi:hypothetical protein
VNERPSQSNPSPARRRATSRCSLGQPAPGSVTGGAACTAAERVLRDTVSTLPCKCLSACGACAQAHAPPVKKFCRTGPPSRSSAEPAGRCPHHTTQVVPRTDVKAVKFFFLWASRLSAKLR